MDYFDSTYYDGDYFDTDEEAPSSGGGSRIRIHAPPPAQVLIEDDGWIHIVL